MSYVEYVIDTETTGTDPNKHDIIEVCFWRIGDPESKTWCLSPLSAANIEDKALQINGHKKEDILHKTAAGKEKYLHPSQVLPDIEMWLMADGAAAEDRIFIGQNPEFDHSFLLKLWERSGDIDNFPFGYWIDNQDGTKRNVSMILDTIDLVRIIDVCTGKHRGRYNLGSLVKSFGITKAQAHRADGDVKMTKDLFEKIIEVFKPLIQEKFSDCY
jgi:DNA polymerase III epsilon subunit-like protein